MGIVDWIIDFIARMLPWILIVLPVYILIRLILHARRKKSPGYVVSWAREICLLVFCLYGIFLLSATILPHISADFTLYYPGGGFSVPEISSEYLAIIMTPLCSYQINI